VENIGIFPFAETEGEEYYAVTDDDLDLLPPRDENGNKATFGKVCLIAGSHGMAGAALLAAQAVFAAGAGMLRIVTPAGNRVIMQETLPEAMLSCYDEVDVCEVVHKACLWADVIAIGPGLSMDRNAKQLLTYCIEKTNKPLVIDADALNLLARNPSLLKYARGAVITPHAKEMERLCGRSVKDILDSTADTAHEFAKKHSLICILKDHETIISDGSNIIYQNTTGNSGMATGGSGDVLAGIVGALLAQHRNSSAMTVDTAALAVYIHGLCGDIASEKLSEYSLMASDVIAAIPLALKRICEI